MITLPPQNDKEGCEARVLLAECRGPAASGYILADAKTCMQLMDRVLWNRLKNPARFGAKGAKTIADIVRAPGQFAGFERYPKYDSSIVNRIQAMINVATERNMSQRCVESHLRGWEGRGKIARAAYHLTTDNTNEHNPMKSLLLVHGGIT